MTQWYAAAHAWLPEGLADDVRIAVDDGRFTAVDVGSTPESADTLLDGLTLPGLANTHSHAFHRALRGRTHDARGSFWTWRERMYSVARRLDPSGYFLLARAVFAEMALAGITCVGEFHYLHHGPDGRPYDDPNAMGAALIAAAAEAGVRITLLDTCYLAGGLSASGYEPLDEVQRRFSDGDVSRWAERLHRIEVGEHARVGAALHSVRAVPRDDIPALAAAAAGRPLHVHLSEQVLENDRCRAAFGVSPTRLLAEAGALTPATTAVHATHVDADDIALLGGHGCAVSICPTTERDLADGVGPARLLSDAGCWVTLGTDQNASIDLIDEARSLEMDERLVSGVRGRFTPDELLVALTRDGHESLGWTDAGRIAVGARADLVTVRLDSMRTAGAAPGQALFAATAADVDSVIVDGRWVVRDGRHRCGDVGRMLAGAIEPLWR